MLSYVLLYMPCELMLCNCMACELRCLSNYPVWENSALMALYCGLIGFCWGIVGV